MEPEFSSPIHTRPILARVLSQTNPFHASPSHLLKIHINIILSSIPRSSKRSLSLTSPHQNSVRTSPLSNTSHKPRPAHFLDFITRILFGER